MCRLRFPASGTRRGMTAGIRNRSSDLSRSEFRVEVDQYDLDATGGKSLTSNSTSPPVDSMHDETLRIAAV